MFCKICSYLTVFITLVILAGVFVGLKSREKIDIGTARLILYHGSNTTNYVSYRLDESGNLTKNSHFNRSLPTVLIIHGYHDSIDGNNNRALTDAYIQRPGNFNVISLDWKELARGENICDYFFDAVPNTIRVGKELARSILHMGDVGFNVEKLHMIGISMGGPLASIAAKQLFDFSSGALKVHRITGLDPTMIPFSLPFFKQLHKSDAVFVDVIHTDAWIYGTPFSVGTVDFYPNGGAADQPGCVSRKYDEYCSHDRAVQYFAESVLSREEDVFYAIKCPSWNYFKLNEYCNVSNIVSMGFHCDLQASGDYFLQTNSTSPYSKGMAGAYALAGKMFN